MHLTSATFPSVKQWNITDHNTIQISVLGSCLQKIGKKLWLGSTKFHSLAESVLIQRARGRQAIEEVNSIARSLTCDGLVLQNRKQLTRLVVAKTRRSLTCLSSAHSSSAVRGYAAYLFRHTANFASCIACPRCDLLAADQSSTWSSPIVRSWACTVPGHCCFVDSVDFCIHCAQQIQHFVHGNSSRCMFIGITHHSTRSAALRIGSLRLCFLIESIYEKTWLSFFDQPYTLATAR